MRPPIPLRSNFKVLQRGADPMNFRLNKDHLQVAPFDTSLELSALSIP
jgi:hypothetical protein